MKADSSGASPADDSSESATHNRAFGRARSTGGEVNVRGFGVSGFGVRAEVDDGVFEGGTDFGPIVSEDSEADLVPDDLPGGMGMQEMVMSTA